MSCPLWRVTVSFATYYKHRCSGQRREHSLPQIPPCPQDGLCCPHLVWVLLNTCCGNHWVGPPQPPFTQS